MSNFFLTIFNFFQHRKMLLWLLLVTIIGLLTFSALRISFVEDISSFFPNNADNRRINEAYQKIGAANKIIVTIAPSNSPPGGEQVPLEGGFRGADLTEAATRFAEILLENDTAGHIKELMYEIDSEKIREVTNFVTQNLPYFLEEEDYLRIDTLIQPRNIENQLKIDKELLMSPMGGFVRNMILNDPLHFSQNALKNLEVFKQGDYFNTDNGFIFNDNGECLVIITSKYPVSETAKNKLLANEIYKAVNQTIAEFDNEIKIVAFGAALISITNADQIKSDSLFAVSIASVLILALLFYFYRNLKSLFFIALSVTFGALFSLGVIVLFKSTVSIIALGISSIIFGIAINYPLHFLAYFGHTPNIKETIKVIVNPLLIGNITTVGAFLSLLFISSDAMKDLGLFSAFLLVGTILFVLIFLPHLLFINHKGHKELHKGHKNNFANFVKKLCELCGKKDDLSFNRLSEFSPEKNKFIVLIFLIFTVVLFFFSFGTKFETNLQEINYMTAEQRTEMNKLIEQNKGKGQTIYVVNWCKEIDEALYVNENFVEPKLVNLKNKNTINTYSGISNFLPSRMLQFKKIERWNEFWQDKKDVFINDFNKIAQKQGFNQGVFDNFIDLMKTPYNTEYENDDYEYIKDFEYFYEPLKDLVENYVVKTDEKYLIYSVINCNSDSSKIVENTITNAYTASYDTSDWGDIFTFDDSSIAEKMVNALSSDFDNVLYICGFIVFAFLFFSFGRIELAILTFIPLTLAWVWILGLMNIFDMKFNIVNIILATFIFGQGDDYTILITEGLIHEYTYRKKMLAKFKNSIILSATILFIAIGMLIFAKHPAMRSLAELAIVGMVSVVMCAFLFPPLIYKWLVYKKEKNRIMPITLWNLLKTIFSFTIFLICSIIVTFVGFILLTIGRKSKQNKLTYHKVLCNGFRFLAKIIPQVKHKIHNPHSETFDKPAVIICNHQSHLDLLYTLLLSPKIITLTNKWVWNSPFYGWIIRYADFLPVVDGIEENIDKLQKFVDDGYSILVFPEGTRSPDCSISRFRKGAFYLAEKLGLDILPLVIHGIGHALPKQEFLMRKGEVNIFIEPRISMNSRMRGENNDLALLEFTKNIRNYYQQKYAEYVKEIETPDYLADKVLKNYIYKGAEIERAVKKSLKKHNNFKKEIENLPETGEITIQNIGYGEFALMAALVRKSLKITAIEEDLDKLGIAKNCASVPENLEFVHELRELTLIINS